MGHHAGGEIVIPLGGRFLRFEAKAGIQWQGGGKGSVVFQVFVDGKTLFSSETRSDSDPPLEISVDLRGAQTLRLLASDAGDGIGCDMANWLDARLERDPEVPEFGARRIFCWALRTARSMP